MSICNQPGCPDFATYRGRCDQHRTDRQRPNATERGYDSQHEADRATYLAGHPICQDPDGCTEPATVLDHIDGLGPNGPRGHDPANWRALCATHHGRRTARDQPGGWNAR